MRPEATLATFLIPLAVVCVSGLALGEGVKPVRIILPPNGGPLVQKAAEVFGRQVGSRCDACVMATGDAPVKVELAVEPGLGQGGFRIADGPSGTVRVVGNDEHGVLYGVGKLLRTSRYGPGGFSPGSWRGTSVPVCPVRGIYFATHFCNFYEAAPIEEVQRYLEDLSLWGVNTLMLCFPTWQFEGFDDPVSQRAIARLKQISRAAKAAGVKVGMGKGNEGFRRTPKELLRTPVPDPMGRHGSFGVNLCPSEPAGHRMLLEDWGRVLDAFGDVGLDYVIYWPYDEGGCGCKDCWPWGSRGYPKLCRDFSQLARAKSPKTQFIVSTWTFDTPPEGEWEGLTRFMAEDKSWADYVMADAHEDYPRYPLEKGVPGGLPLLNFPEISMWGQSPWGGYGANPFPHRLQRLWDQTQRKLSGGTPYSEGTYEDLNAVICSQFYWDPARPAAETVKEYIAFEYSPDVIGDVAAAIEIFEQNHLRNRIGPHAARAHELIQTAEQKLTPQTRRTWRWRVLALRALIDAEMLKHQGRLEGQALKEAFAELTTLYHAENAHSMPIRPPQVRTPESKQ